MRVCSICQRCYDDSVTHCSEEGHPALSETRDGSPEMIAGYRLDSLIRSGLKGDVYRAHQTASGASCLIRIVSTNEGSGEHFFSEAKLAITLIHPNIADVYEAGSLDSGKCFVVAEQPDGQTLHEYLKSVRIPDLLTTIRVV